MFPTTALGFALAALPRPAEAFDCRAVFDALRSEVETNYVAYAIEYRGHPDRMTRYGDMTTEVAALAERSGDRLDCTRLLNRYVDFFSDPHLFLQDAPRYDEARQQAFRDAAPRSSETVEALRAAALASASPLAGVWATDEGDVAILPSGDGFQAVMIAPRHDAWRVGDIRGRMTSNGAGYDVLLYRTADRAPVLHLGARLEGDLRLRMAPLTWGRIEPRPSLGDAFDPNQPRRPIYVDHSPEVGILYLPSFDPEKTAEAGMAIMRDHGGAMVGKRLLVIDIRGNEGGSQAVWAELASLYATGSWEPDDRPRVGSRDVILAAPRVIEIWEQFRDGTGPGEYRDTLTDLVERLRAAPPGSLAPFRPDLDGQEAEPFTPAQVAPGPQAVAILTDRLVVSAGEAFLIDARRSPKVTIFGENSMGSIDYWTVGMVAVGEGESRYLLGLPIGAASDALPAGGFNAEGVPVDVRLSGSYDSWLRQVLTHYGLN